MTVPRLPPSPIAALGHANRRLWNLERAVNATAPTGLVTGEAGPIIAVAAGNTPQILKQFAAYVCTGADDQTTVLAALRNCANGGQVLLLPGDFYFTNHVNLSSFYNPQTSTGAAVIVQGAGGTTVHFTSVFAFSNRFDIRDVVFTYEGDLTVGRFAAVGAANLYRCSFWNCGASTDGDMVGCRSYGRYAPDAEYIPGLDWVFQAQFADRCAFGMAAPNNDCLALAGNMASVVNCMFLQSPSTTDDALWWRSVITIGHETDAIGTQNMVRGNRVQVSGDVDVPLNCIEYGVRNFGDSWGACIEGNSFAFSPNPPDLFGDPTYPYIVGVSYVDASGFFDITVRDNHALGFGTFGVSSDFLPEQGYGHDH